MVGGSFIKNTNISFDNVFLYAACFLKEGSFFVKSILNTYSNPFFRALFINSDKVLKYLLFPKFNVNATIPSSLVQR